MKSNVLEIIDNLLIAYSLLDHDVMGMEDIGADIIFPVLNLIRYDKQSSTILAKYPKAFKYINDNVNDLTVFKHINLKVVDESYILENYNHICNIVNYNSGKISKELYAKLFNIYPKFRNQATKVEYLDEAMISEYAKDCKLLFKKYSERIISEIDYSFVERNYQHFTKNSILAMIGANIEIPKSIVDRYISEHGSLSNKEGCTFYYKSPIPLAYKVHAYRDFPGFISLDGKIISLKIFLESTEYTNVMGNFCKQKFESIVNSSFDMTKNNYNDMMEFLHKHNTSSYDATYTIVLCSNGNIDILLNYIKSFSSLLDKQVSILLNCIKDTYGPKFLENFLIREHSLKLNHSILKSLFSFNFELSKDFYIQYIKSGNRLSENRLLQVLFDTPKPLDFTKEDVIEIYNYLEIEIPSVVAICFGIHDVITDKNIYKRTLSNILYGITYHKYRNFYIYRRKLSESVDENSSEDFKNGASIFKLNVSEIDDHKYPIDNYLRYERIAYLQKCGSMDRCIFIRLCRNNIELLKDNMDVSNLLIDVGCSHRNKKDTIKRIKNDYSNNPIMMSAYILDVESCYDQAKMFIKDNIDIINRIIKSIG